jgi:hypothetical protein
MTGERVRQGRRGRVVGLVLALSLLALAEVGLRLALPDWRLLDRRGERYWILRMGERMRPDGSFVLMRDVRLDHALGWTMKPRLATGSETTNSRGMRARADVPHERTPGVRRIVAIGDAFTFGFDVDDESTFCARLEARARDIEVLDLGVNGYGTDQELLMWEREGWRYRPDVVLLGLHVEDFHRNALAVAELPKPRFRLERGELVLDPGPLPLPWDLLAERLAASRSRVRLADLVGYVWRRVDGGEPDAVLEEKAALQRALLARLASSTEEHGARLVVVLIPHDRPAAYPDHARIVRVVEEAARALDLALLDLAGPLEAWRAAHPDAPLVTAPGGAWSAAGHAVAAEEIAAFLRTRGLLPPRVRGTTGGTPVEASLAR